MKFISLKMHNWRSYHGENVIHFSTDPARPVTLLLGPNGAGKTALLNAFTWAIYGEFTEGFSHPEQLVNLEAAALTPDTALAWVEVEFEHDGVVFKIHRETDVSRQELSKYSSNITMNGETAYEADVAQVLPHALKDFFFFPAESFSRATVLQDGAQYDVGTAIRSLLKGHIYKNAADDLSKAIAHKSLKPPTNYKDVTIEAAQLKYAQTQADLTAAEERRDQLPAELAKAKDELGTAKKSADRFDPKKLREREDNFRLLNDSLNRSKQLVAKSHDLYIDLSRKAHLHFSYCATEQAISRLDQAEAAGLMPPRVHESVLEQSLDGKCLVCGQEPLDGAAIQRVKTLLETVGDAKVAIRGLETRTILRQFLDKYECERRRLLDEVSNLANELGVSPPQGDGDMRTTQFVLRICIDTSSRKLTNDTKALATFIEKNEDQAYAEGQNPLEVYSRCQAKVHALERETANSLSTVKAREKDKNEAFSDYENKSGKLADHKQKTKAITFLDEAKSYFAAAREGMEEYGRIDFQQAINAAYKDLISKSYEIEVGQDFNIKVIQSDYDVEMPLSQSETVLLLIAFLGAIARLAPEYERIAKQGQQFEKLGEVTTSQNTGFAVVLDSPTSPLDDEYEEDVVNALPNLLPQVIVPVSAKSIDVWEQISDKIGQTYVMELTAQTASNRRVRWGGKDYQYSIEDPSMISARTRITRAD